MKMISSMLEKKLIVRAQAEMQRAISIIELKIIGFSVHEIDLAF